MNKKISTDVNVNKTLHPLKLNLQKKVSEKRHVVNRHNSRGIPTCVLKENYIFFQPFPIDPPYFPFGCFFHLTHPYKLLPIVGVYNS
jgi:hypothetical protein